MTEHQQHTRDAPSTERGPIWAWYKRRVGLEDNPFWEAWERQPLKLKRRFWWHIAWGGRILALTNLVCLFAFSILAWGKDLSKTVQTDPIHNLLTWWGGLMSTLVPVLSLLLLSIWFRSALLASSETRSAGKLDLLFISRIKIRQLYWARATPRLRETLNFWSYLLLSIVPLFIASTWYSSHWLTVTPRGWESFFATWGPILIVLLVLAFFTCGSITTTVAIALTKRTVGSALAWPFFTLLACGTCLIMLLNYLNTLPFDTLLSRNPPYLYLVMPQLLLLPAVIPLLFCGPLYVRWLDRKRDPAGTGR